MAFARQELSIPALLSNASKEHVSNGSNLDARMNHLSRMESIKTWSQIWRTNVSSQVHIHVNRPDCPYLSFSSIIIGIETTSFR